MELTLATIVNARQSLQNLVGQKLPAKTAFKLYKNVEKINKELEFFEKSRQDCFTRLGKDEGNGMYSILPENGEQYAQEMAELLATKVEIDVAPVKIGEITVELSASEVMDLAFLLEE